VAVELEDMGNKLSNSLRFKYRDYILFAAKTSLKSRYSNFYLGNIWLVLEPILFMLVYAFIYQVVFQRTMEHYLVFVLTGLIAWRWINGTIIQSTSAISSKISILDQVSAPKFIFVMVIIAAETLLWSITQFLIFGAMAFDGLSFTWHLIEVIPVTLVAMVTLFGIGIIVAHIGSLFSDFKPLIGHVLRLAFYLSPIFYDVTLLPEEYRIVFWVNPITWIVGGYRSIYLYGSSPDYLGLLYVLAIGLVLIPIGLYLLRHYDMVYMKIK